MKQNNINTSIINKWHYKIETYKTSFQNTEPLNTSTFRCGTVVLTES